MRSPTQAELDQALGEWQRKLRLEHWDVTIALVEKARLVKGALHGESEFMPSKRLAQIRVLRAEEVGPDDWIEYDWERIVVHELLHLHLYTLRPKRQLQYETLEEEQIVHTLSVVLLAEARAARVRRVA